MSLNDSEFRNKFSKTSIKRIGRDRFIRNVLIAIGNSNNKKFIDDIIPLLKDKSDLVRAMAIWALNQISSENEFEALKKKFLINEINSEVRQEWLN